MSTKSRTAENSKTAGRRKLANAALIKQYAKSIEAKAGSMISGQGKYNLLKSSGRFTRGLGNLVLAAGAKKLGVSGSGLYTSPEGMGAYRSGSYGSGNSNNLVSGAGQSYGRMASMKTSRDETGTVMISHREYLTDIYGPGTSGSGVSTPFSNQIFTANPGLQQSFPFASQIAMNYTEYGFVQLIYEYRSVTTDVGTSSNGQCGTVIMAFNYNAAEGPFTDKQTMMEYGHSSSCKVTENMTYGVECDPQKKSGSQGLYIAASPIIPLQDVKTYHWGTMNVGLANLPKEYNGLPVGELWVYYKFYLRKPRLYASRGYDIDTDMFFTSAAKATLTAAAPWGAAANTTFLRGQQNSIGCLLTPQANGVTVTFPAGFNGNIRIQICLTGTVMTTYTAPPYAAGNVVQVVDQYGTAGIPSTGIPNCLSGSTSVGGITSFGQWDFYVTQSSNGINNTVFFASIAATTVVSSFMRIESYQAMGSIGALINLATSRPNFVDVNGTVTVPS